MAVKVKDDLKYLALHLPAKATYSDAMYELYVRMKVAQGMEDVAKGRVMPHEQVRRRIDEVVCGI